MTSIAYRKLGNAAFSLIYTVLTSGVVNFIIQLLR